MTTAYDIRLVLTHGYASPAGNGRHILRVLPKQIAGRQHVTAHLLEVSPNPTEREESVDFFGNSATSVVHVDPHDRMEIRMSARVEVSAPDVIQESLFDFGDLNESLIDSRDMSSVSPLHFLGPSPRLSPNSEIAAFAADLFQPEIGIAANITRIGANLNAVMTFDPEATTVETDPVDAFRNQRGVCQDYTHIMIIALRSLGIPAGYVSGFLRTRPPPGGVRLEGADAMHAWVQAWCGPTAGWMEYDPTNSCLPATDHIIVAFGRDYLDVSPIIGHLRASGELTSDQAVDVVGVAGSL